MKEFEKIIMLGRSLATSHGFRGSLIQLEGDIAYFTNVRRSILFKITFPRPIGTGTFYANEAPLQSELIERREDRVMFQWREDGGEKRIFVPNRISIKDDSESQLAKYYVEPNIRVPLRILDDITDKIPITSIRIAGSKLTIRQFRGDGSAEIETDRNLGAGLVKPDYPDSDWIHFYTRDIFHLKGVIDSDIYFSLAQRMPLSFATSILGAKLMGLISYLEYES